MLTENSYSQTVFFQESFDDNEVANRGWYDNTNISITTTEHISNSAGSAEFKFLKGAKTPTQGGGMRRLFTPSDEVFLSYWVKYSSNWVGSQKPYHPHEFSFVTTENDKWVGPAYTHLTTYIEQNGGTPLLAIQDGDNVDETAIGKELRYITENRAVSGCNGTSDSYPPGDCYLNGSLHWNGKVWKAAQVFFTDSPGEFYKNDWHFVEAYFKLNSIVDGKEIPDGIIRYWFDGKLIIDAPEASLRTGQFADMKFNQLLIAPYIGDGSPIEQTMWVDELTVASSRILSGLNEIRYENELFEISPNPLTSIITVKYSLASSGKIKLEIFDLLGNKTATLTNSEQMPGTYSNVWNSEGYDYGIYYCRLTINDNSKIIKVIKVR